MKDLKESQYIFNPPAPLNTPVLFLVFNRPETTSKVFETIQQAKPPRLYVAADGPREKIKGEVGKARRVREIATQVDWECEVKTLFRDENLGCKVAVSSAIDWFFENEEEGIILEDDCVPHPSFFPFCQELLDRYRNDERISMIGGINFQFGQKRGLASYYFSKYNHIWGWASWRRSWEDYDVSMQKWPILRDTNWLTGYLKSWSMARFWSRRFEKAYAGKIDTWDYQWFLACWVASRLTIVPNTNLISNIGMHDEATHTTNKKSKLADMKTEALTFPLCHPTHIFCDKKADTFYEHKVLNNNFINIALREIFSIFR